jgi:hypothetical protein
MIPNGNDDFDTPIVIPSSPYSNMQDTTLATTAGDDPSFDCGDSFSGPGSHSVWYKYTASANGTLTVDTLGSNYDTVLAVWTGVRGNLSLQACNDDTPSRDLQSKVEIPVISGTVYHIEIVGFDLNEFGDLDMALSFESDVTVTPTATPTATATATVTPGDDFEVHLPMIVR